MTVPQPLGPWHSVLVLLTRFFFVDAACFGQDSLQVGPCLLCAAFMWNDHRAVSEAGPAPSGPARGADEGKWTSLDEPQCSPQGRTELVVFSE